MRCPRAAWPLLALVAGVRPLGAQIFTRPELRWESLRTQHFDLYFPHAMRAWGIDAAGRLEAVHGPVARLVGHAPRRRVAVVIDDPYNVSNGAALPVLNEPTIVLWPTPPEPSDNLGNAPDWAALLAAHEFTHIAHLTWPSRNPADRTLWRVLPVDLGPIARRAPRWVMEAYAVYIEGLLEGGRPHSASRAAVLREFAIEGRLPAYGALDGSGAFLGDDMEYLVGSAYLEWLVRRDGEASLPHLWRRLSARVNRTFDEAFVGVYGDSPGALYGRFTAELTGKALQAAQLITSAGLDTGQIFQHLTWYTGAPALSPDGRRLAIPVRVPGEPSRIVVWATGPAPIDSATIEARRWLLSRDPQDVPAVQVYPAPRQPLATLEAARGTGYDNPRFFTDSQHVLVTHIEPRPDGAIRPDLFEWDMRANRVRRITHGAAIRDADPAPHGRTALGVRCLDGVCDLVRIFLSSGRVAVVLKGTPRLEFTHPRFAPDGQRALVAVHDTAGWHDEEITFRPDGGADRRRIGPDDGANRFGAAYVAGGHSVVSVSDLGGVEHLELIDAASGTVRMLAATTGSTTAPDGAAGDTSVYFLTLSARGRDLHRVSLAAARDVPPPVLPPTLAPAAVPESQPLADSTPPPVVGTPTGYGVGPREYLYLPGGGFGPAGRYLTLSISSSDPVGRLDWTLQGAYGTAGSWRGAAGAGAWHGWPVTIGASAFAVADFPSRATAGSFAPPPLDAALQGGVLSADLVRYGGLGTGAARIGLSAAHLAPESGPEGARELAFAGYTAVADLSRGSLVLAGGAGALASGGRTEDVSWRRLLARASLFVGVDGFLIHYSAVYAAVDGGAPLFERPVVGGDAPPLTDSAVLAQRIADPALPVGVVLGSEVFGQRLEDLAGPFAAYYERFLTPTDHNAPHDLYGLEARGTAPTVPFLAVPSASGVVGLGYSISAPYKYKLRAYLAVRYAP